MRHSRPSVATPGTSATQTIYDDGANTSGHLISPSYMWITIACKLDQPCIINHKWGPEQSSADGALIVINNDGSGDGIVAGELFLKNYRMRPGRNKFEIVAGSPAPTAAKVAYELNTFDGDLP